MYDNLGSQVWAAVVIQRVTRGLLTRVRIQRCKGIEAHHGMFARSPLRRSTISLCTILYMT